MVALLTESVDWNWKHTAKTRRSTKVALLTESVDWNLQKRTEPITITCRSPHGERGLKLMSEYELKPTPNKSLSSRRAWIEINNLYGKMATSPGRSPHGERGLKFFTFDNIAPPPASRSPHGERGLKYKTRVKALFLQKSLSSRRAWIEICCLITLSLSISSSLSSRRAWIEIPGMLWYKGGIFVALLTESVDWNEIYLTKKALMLRRSPHGERGLKFEDGDYDFEVTKSLSSRRAWIEIKQAT